MTKTRPPILPANKQDPTGVDRIERGAMREFGRRIRKIARGYVKLLDRIPAEPVVNKTATDTKARRYSFRLDQFLLASILEEGAGLVDSLLADPRDPWFFEAYVAVAYRRGTAQEFANLAQQSPAYLAGQQDLAAIMRSDPYRRRMALVQAREFEEMQKLGLGVRSAMSRILTDGIGRGLNPRVIARNLMDRAGIEEGRANRIARTEITTALRRARWDESDEGAEKYGLRGKQMHLSALSPTTRATHAARHGNLYTTEQVRDWYSRDGNSINCFIPTTEVRGRFVAGSKAHYRGDVVEIVTAGGRNLTVTLNHPVMTARGLVAAAELHEGDDLIAYVGKHKNSIGISALDGQLVDARIDDVFRSLVDVGHMRSRRVGAVDFHGDARFMDENVDVVDVDGILTFGADASIGEFLDDFALKHSDLSSAKRCPEDQFFGGAKFAANSVVRSLRPHLAERWAEPFRTQGSGLTHASCVESAGGEVASDRRAGEPDVSAELLHGFSSHMSSIQIGGCMFLGNGAALRSRNPPPGEPSIDSAFTDVELFSDVFRCLPAGVETDQVVNLRRREYAGHVYDLQEVSGLMFAGDILTSNCKCSQTFVLVDENGKPLVPAIQQRALDTKRVMREKHNGPWADEEE